MVFIFAKPRHSEQLGNGVFCFVPPTQPCQTKYLVKEGRSQAPFANSIEEKAEVRYAVDFLHAHIRGAPGSRVQ